MSFGLNAEFSLVTNMLGIRADPYQVFNFLVEIENTFAGAFSECTGLIVETEVATYQEGGVNEYALVRVADEIAEPVAQARAHAHRRTVALASGRGQRKVERRNGTVYLLDKFKGPVLWWDFKGACPVKWTGPDLKAESARGRVRNRGARASRVEPAEVRRADRRRRGPAGRTAGSIAPGSTHERTLHAVRAAASPDDRAARRDRYASAPPSVSDRVQTHLRRYVCRRSCHLIARAGEDTPPAAAAGLVLASPPASSAHERLSAESGTVTADARTADVEPTPVRARVAPSPERSDRGRSRQRVSSPSGTRVHQRRRIA